MSSLGLHVQRFNTLTHTTKKHAYLSFLLLSLLTICVSVPVSEKIFHTFDFFCLNMKRRKYSLVSSCMLLNFRQFSAAVHHKIIFNNITKRDAILFYKRKSTHLAASDVQKKEINEEFFRWRKKSEHRE